MSRSGYSDDCDDNWQVICWQGAVKKALRGKRGQQFLRDLAAALDAMPEKVLISGALQTAEGDVCAIGAVCRSRGLDTSDIQWDDEWFDGDLADELAERVGIATAMAREVMYENDDGGWRETPAERWQRMRHWVDRHLKEAPHAE